VADEGADMMEKAGRIGNDLAAAPKSDARRQAKTARLRADQLHESHRPGTTSGSVATNAAAQNVWCLAKTGTEADQESRSTGWRAAPSGIATNIKVSRYRRPAHPRARRVDFYSSDVTRLLRVEMQNERKGETWLAEGAI
jgi:hypothetical protein